MRDDGNARGRGDAAGDVPPHAFWFGEDQARYVVTAKGEAIAAVTARAAAAGVPVVRLGVTGGHALAISGERPIGLHALTERFEQWLPAYMAAAAA